MVGRLALTFDELRGSSLKGLDQPAQMRPHFDLVEANGFVIFRIQHKRVCSLIGQRHLGH